MTYLDSLESSVVAAIVGAARDVVQSTRSLAVKPWVQKPKRSLSILHAVTVD